MATAADVRRKIEQSGLIDPGDGVLALLSGGADSVCLVHALRELIGADRLQVLHVNHGLRAAADEDERFCAQLCERLGLRLQVERVALAVATGNTEALAREARYGAAESVRRRERLDLIATGHTATDQVETVLYRLASSPGRRALLGMRARNGRIVRPLLALTHVDTRAYCKALRLEWREDESNLDRTLARNRLRHDVIPALRKIHPAIERNVIATAEELRDEFDLLERVVDDELVRLAAGGNPPAIEAARLVGIEPALRRLVLRRLTELAAGGPLPLRAEQLKELERLAALPGSAQLDLGGGIQAVCEYGVIRFRRAADTQISEPATLPLPGRCRFGAWQISSELAPDAGAALARLDWPDEALLDAAPLADELTVRSWREGDRMQPLGLGGTKSLQDLFTDRKVPRSLRSTLPVVESEGEIAWVAGIAVSELFKVTDSTDTAVRLRARTTA